MLKRTDTSDPSYYHKVVDCQYACPAHTPVPEYIRLIAFGRYTEAYLVNRASNVFPGILGRICDRPCEPACRRGRVAEQPVAICRLKRAAADFKDASYREHLPKIPTQKNGKKVALVGAGPASLTVVNDLMPLGYTCVLYDKKQIAGGAVAQQVPEFRLPREVLQEECQNIIDMGVENRLGTEVTSLQKLLDEGYDAVFLGSGAPIGRDLTLPGRQENAAYIQIGLDFLANVNFGHLKKISGHVLVIGGGNTAMDCCRTALRLGASKVSVFAPEGFDEMLASPWEKEDALKEGVHVVNNYLPQEFVAGANGLSGVRFQHLSSCYTAKKEFRPIPSGQPDLVLDCQMVVLAVGQEVQFSYAEPGLLALREGGRGIAVDRLTHQTSHPKVFAGGDAAFGASNMITSVAHGHAAAISIHLFCQGKDVAKDREKPSMTLRSQKMTLNQWAYVNDFSDTHRHHVPEHDLAERLNHLEAEVELGFDIGLALKETKRCLNCDVQTVFKEKACIECDACVDICPSMCLNIIEEPESEVALRAGLKIPAENLATDLFVATVPQTKKLMVKDENICIHCGLCAERCPTDAWDMKVFSLHLPKAGNL